MRRVLTLGIIIVCTGLLVGLVLRGNSRGNGKTTQNSNNVTLTPTTTTTPKVTITSTTTPTVLSQSTKSNTCSSLFTKAKKTAIAFMDAHKQRDTNTVLSLISPPLSDDEMQQYNFLEGLDTQDGARLYTAAQFSYTTKSYTFGTFSSNGDDPQSRGAHLCALNVYETRVSTASSSYSETTETRYLVFSFEDELDDITLVAFRNTKNGGKYSGFN